MGGQRLGREVVDGAADGLRLVRDEVQTVPGGGGLRLDLLGKMVVELLCAGGFARCGQAGDYYQLGAGGLATAVRWAENRFEVEWQLTGILSNDNKNLKFVILQGPTELGELVGLTSKFGVDGGAPKTRVVPLSLVLQAYPPGIR